MLKSNSTKRFDNYTLNPYLENNIVGENKDIIRLYKPASYNYGDSITSYLEASDSLNNTIIDTIKFVFLESNRKPSAFSYTYSKTKLDFVDNPGLEIKFSKPVAAFDTTKVSIQSDTLFVYKPSFRYIWNENKTKLALNFNVTSSSLDSLLTMQDTIKTDTTYKPTSTTRPALSVFTETGAFISVEQDTSSVKSIPLRKPDAKSTGVLSVALNTASSDFTFQLLDNNNEVAYSKANQKNFSFPSVKSGKYKIRVLIDSNRDGNWSYGNLLQNEEPEEIFIYEEETSIRENWVVELNISF